MEKVLVVVDMQNDFVDGALGTEEAVAIVGNAVEKIKNFDGKIYATLDTHRNDYLSTREGEALPVPHCIRMTIGWLLNPYILNALSDKDFKYVEKNTFGSLQLASIIKLDHESDFEIEIIGLCTDICVVSNALILRAYFPDAKITVDVSCCAGVTPEKHKAAIETMKSCQIDIIGEN